MSGKHLFILGLLGFAPSAVWADYDTSPPVSAAPIIVKKAAPVAALGAPAPEPAPSTNCLCIAF